MMVSTVTRDVLTPRTSRSYCIRLKVSAAARADAWDLYEVAVHYGSVEKVNNHLEVVAPPCTP